MNSVETILSRAARRSLIDRSLDFGGLGLCTGLLAALAVLILDRLMGWGLSWELYATIPAAAGLAGLAYAAVNRPSRFALARRLDRSLDLKDRIGTVKALDASPANPVFDPAFAAMAQHDAQELARRIDVKRAFPVEPSAIWMPAAVLALLLASGVMFLPAFNFVRKAGLDASKPALTAQQIKEINSQSSAVSESIKQALNELPPGQALDDAAKAQMDSLDRIARQLAEPQPGAEHEVGQVRDESAARLNELADQIADKAEREKEAATQLAERFKGMDALDAPKPPLSAQQFAEALKRGDFGEAAKQLDRLLDAPDLSEADRQATADHLRRLAEQVKQEDSAEMAARDARRQSLEKALRDQGLDDQAIQRLLDDPASSTDDIRKALNQGKADPDVAERIARQADESRQASKLDQAVQKDAEDLGHALDRAADTLEQPKPPEAPPTTRSDNPSPPSTTKPHEAAPATRPESPEESEPPTSTDSQSSKESAGKTPTASTRPDHATPSDADASKQEDGTSKQPSPGDVPAASRPESASPPLTQQNQPKSQPRNQANASQPAKPDSAQPVKQGSSHKPEASQDQSSSQPSNPDQASGAQPEATDQPTEAEPQPGQEQPKQSSTTQPGAGPSRLHTRPDSSPGAKQVQQQNPQEAVNQSPERQSNGEQSPATQPGAADQPSAATQQTEKPQPTKSQSATQPSQKQPVASRPTPGQQSPSPQGKSGESPKEFPSTPGAEAQPAKPEPNPGSKPETEPQPDGKSPTPSGTDQTAKPQAPESAAKLGKPDQSGAPRQEQGDPRVSEQPKQPTESQHDSTPCAPKKGRPQPQPNGQAGPQPKPQDSIQPSDAAPDSNNPNPTPQPPSETLRKLAERAAKAAEGRQVSDKLKKAAQDIANNMTPEQREQWARQWQREHGAPPPTMPEGDQPGQRNAADQNSPAKPNGNGDSDKPFPEDTGHGGNPSQRDDKGNGPDGSPQGDHRSPSTAGTPAGQLPAEGTAPVDLRGTEAADELIAQWLSDHKPDAGPRATSAATDQRVRAAQSVAERAVNDSAVQKRYHKSIQRYFGRLNETIQKASGGGAPSAPAIPTPAPPATQPGGG